MNDFAEQTKMLVAAMHRVVAQQDEIMKDYTPVQQEELKAVMRKFAETLWQ
jgi:hypothetical protein